MTWKALILIIFSSFLLAACSSAATPTPETSTAPPPTSAPAPDTTRDASPTSVPASDTTPSSERPPQGGKLVRLYQDPPTLDPHLTTDNISGGLVNEIFGGLVTLDLDLDVVPDLAPAFCFVIADRS